MSGYLFHDYLHCDISFVTLFMPVNYKDKRLALSASLNNGGPFGANAPQNSEISRVVFFETR